MDIYLDLRLNPALRYIVIISLLALALPSLGFLTLHDPTLLTIFVDSLGLLYNTLGVVTFAWATYRMRSAEPYLFRAWFVLTLSMLITLLYLGLWMFEEVILQRQPAPITGAGFAFIANCLFGWGFYLMPTVKLTKAQLVRRLLDAVTVLAGSALLLWCLWIHPLLHHSTATASSLLVALLYPVCDFALIAALVTLLFQEQLLQPRESLFLLGVATIFMIVADLVFGQQVATDTYQAGNWSDYLWLVALVAAATGGALQATAVKRKRTLQPLIAQSRLFQGVQVALPPLMLLMTYAIMILFHVHDHQLTYLLMTSGVGLMFVLVSARQLLTIIENRNLAVALRTELAERQRVQGALQRTNELLEEHVLVRTRALAAANEQLRQNEQRLRFDAFHDKLTGLPNRAYFIDRVERALRRTDLVPTDTFAVLFLDCDSFKVVNDSLGHWVGDEFLVNLGRRLQACVVEGDLVARLGGDEFVILQAHVADQRAPITMAARIQDALRQPIVVGEHQLFTSVSIGIVLNDGHYTVAGDLLRDADIAMYRAKTTGKARCVVFDTTMRTDAAARLGLEADLRTALLDQKLALAYQPIWHLGEQRLAGFEALVRWPHPTQGLIPPDTFIPIAEETGLIIPLGSWVLEEACRQLKRWHEQWPQSASLTMSVNISARQLYQTDLPALVRQLLHKWELAPTCLKLEITESVYLEDIVAATAAFADLHALGIQLQLDDFGTGYSSFSYLHRLPIHTLKIDRSFIQHVATDERHREIVRAIITLAHNLHLDVIAEGVETVEQLAHVTRLGCEQAQGYLIAKPLDRLAAEQFIHAFRMSNPVEATYTRAPEQQAASYCPQPTINDNKWAVPLNGTMYQS